VIAKAITGYELYVSGAGSARLIWIKGRLTSLLLFVLTCSVYLLQEIDGQSLMLLSLPTIQEHLELKLGPAVKLCHQIERVKIAFFEQFANDSQSR